MDAPKEDDSGPRPGQHPHCPAAAGGIITPQPPDGVQALQRPQECTEEEGEDGGLCRICFDAAPLSQLCAPCDCTGGSQYVHRECLQAWILTPKTHQSFDAAAGDSVCEVCGAAWRGEWRLPDPRSPVDPSEVHAERLRVALRAAYFRSVYGMQRPNDNRLLATVGVHFAGPWSGHAAKLAKKERRKGRRRSCTIA